jgi:hypothetical protein
MPFGTAFSKVYRIKALIAAVFLHPVSFGCEVIAQRLRRMMLTMVAAPFGLQAWLPDALEIEDESG